MEHSEVMTMRPVPFSARARVLARCALVLLVAIWAIPGHAQSQDRERAQMLQMQQQLQRLQSDNAALLHEKTQLQEQVKDVERLKKESAQTDKELAQSRAQSAAGSREAAALRRELDALREQSSMQLDQWKKALADRDGQLQFAAQEKRRVESANALLETRLKLQTERSDVCETKHAQAMRFAERIVDKYAQGRLRLCDPFVAMWKVHDREEIEGLRDEMYEFRLDVPAIAAQATGGVGTAAEPVVPAATMHSGVPPAATATPAVPPTPAPQK